MGELIQRKGRVEDFNQSLIPPINPKFVPFGAYPIVSQVIKSGKFAPIYIYGNSGYGKTQLVEQACANLGKEFILAAITSDTTDENLLGSETLIDGNLVWQDGPVTTAARRGAILLIDEISQATEKIMCLQEILQNRPYLITRTGEYIHPKEGFMIFATDNTKGTGDVGGRFIGSRPLNYALMQRFYGMYEQPYPDQATEEKILKNYTEDKDLVRRLCKWAHSIRVSYDEGASEYEICTRRLTQIVVMNQIFDDEKESLRLALNMFEDDFKDAAIELYDTLFYEN